MDRSLVEEAFTYHQPTPEMRDSMLKIRAYAKELAFVILEECPSSADRSDALRKLREVVFAANSSIVLNGII